MSFLDNQNALLQKVRELSESFDKNREAVRKELAESLAEADRDFGYFRQSNKYDENELQNIAERMRLRATQFEAEHPKLSEVFKELAELLRGMGL